MNVPKYAAVLLVALTCGTTLVQSLPCSMAVRDDRLHADQIDQAFFRDLEQYRLSAQARRARVSGLPTAFSRMSASDYDRS